MCGMTDPTASAVLRLDPRRCIVWRDPTTLQIGIDPALAVLEGIDGAELRLVDALAVGITRERLHGLAGHLGVPHDRVAGMLARLGAALEPTGPSAAPSAASTAGAEPIAVIGHGLGAERVAAVLAESGHPVALVEPGAPIARRPRVAVLVSTHVIDPLEHARWLRRDRPHLPVVFGEVAVTVGPLVLPGETACLRCVEQWRAVEDPARTVLATQLWGRPAAAETATTALAAGLAVRGMLRTSPAGASLRIDALTGATTSTAWSPHPACGCRELSSRAAPAARRGTGSAPARPVSAPVAAPTTAPVLAGRA